MARIILTTCGTSLYNSSCWQWNGLNRRPLSGASDRIELRRRQIGCEAEIIGAKNIDISGRNLARTFDIYSWNNPLRLRDLPAELASLKSIKMYLENPKINQPLTTGDQIVLIHPDSNNSYIDGKFCGDVLQKVITDFDLLSPVSNIITHEIKNLAPANREKFSDALNKIWKYALEIRGLNEINDIILNLTGGYKGLAILLGAFGRGFHGIPMFYLHEEAGYDQIFMMKFENGNIVYSYYDAQKNQIREVRESAGPP